ncbi:MAG: hypothetical protein U0746_03415 [Gemmataceae bacterium]
MFSWFRDLDRVLRGDATRADTLRYGTVDSPPGRLAAAGVMLAAIYGLCMGVFGLFNRPEPEYLLPLNGAVKVPALFALTLLVTFPSLYVFNALLGSRLTLSGLARLLAAALGVTLAVLASFGPILAFFSVTTTSHPFIVLLNVVLCTVSGVLGMAFLLRTLDRLVAAMNEPEPSLEPVPVARAVRPADRRVRAVFLVWVVLFGLVGAQTGWVLRPFIGNPAVPFTWFRQREASFFEAILQLLRSLVS